MEPIDTAGGTEPIDTEWDADVTDERREDERGIEDVLCAHRITTRETPLGTVYGCESPDCDYDTEDWTAWEEHVAPHIRNALAAARHTSEAEAGAWALADAWDEGRAAGIADVDTSGYGGIADTPNPYRAAALRAGGGA